MIFPRERENLQRFGMWRSLENRERDGRPTDRGYAGESEKWGSAEIFTYVNGGF
jgi:hypothetical protein